jgi:hypothetical protein
MSNWLSKMLGKGPKPYEPVSSQVKFIDQYNGETEHTMPIVVTPPKQQYIIKNDGQYFVYNSKEEMEPELRDEISRIENIDKFSSSYTIVMDGKRQVYSSFEEIPEDIQAAIRESEG